MNPELLLDRQKRTDRAVSTGLFSNILLAAVKVVAGIFGHSQALLADGINSTSDVAYYIAVKIFFKLARKPADREHPYGHHQMESIAALMVGAFVLTTAVAVFWDSVNKVYDLFAVNGQNQPIAFYALWIALATVGIKIWLFIYTRNIGREIKNAGVLALAYDHRNDIFSAVGASIGITMGLLGYSWVDPLAGAVVAVVILRTGIEIVKESSDDLMDTVPAAALEEQIKSVVKEIPDVCDVEDVHAHRFGPFLVLNITVGIDGSLTVAKGDEIATRIEDRLCAEMELVKKVYVHYHPAGCRRPR
ncbi:MAG TPA: cation transporter [Lentisphaeria bacterium]|nr:MAG: hypothetical protein A2X45_00305 [Lentisphaerae bacterium GWF2_50_93]HCE44324.1 cation transporter [Lentisphaeria bacterium]